MDFLGTHRRINRAIDTLLASQSATTPDAVQAVKLLQSYGTSAIPILLEACTRTHNTEPLVKLLRTFVRNETLQFFRKGLASTNARVVAGAVDALSQGNAYDPNLLLAFLTDPRISKGAIGKLLNTHKWSLAPVALLRRLDEVSPQDRSMLLRLVFQTATVDVVPALMQRLRSPDEDVRMTCTRTLARFPSEAVCAAFYQLLSDPHPMVRITALDALEQVRLPLDLKAICRLLWDAHDGVRREAKKCLARCNDPQLANHLFDILEDTTSAAHTDAADLLGTVRDFSIIHDVVATRPRATVTRDTLLRLLDASSVRTRQAALVGLTSVKSQVDIQLICPLLWDSNSYIRQLAGVILTHYKVPQTLETLCRAFKDESTAVRQGAMAILNVIANPPILKALLSAFRDAAEGMTARAVDALAYQGGPQVIHTALQLMADKDEFLRRTVHTILTRTENPAVVPFLTEVLTHAEPWMRRCAAEVLGMLGPRGREAVPTLLEMAQANEAEGVLALHALTKIGDPRAIPVCLTYMQSSAPTLQQDALQALTVLTDAKNFDMVLYRMLGLRDTVAAERKEPFNRAAAALVRRFPNRVASVKPLALPMPDASEASEVHSQEPSVPPPAEPRSAMPTPGQLDTMQDDYRAMPSGAILGGRYQVIRKIGAGGFGSVVLVKDMMVKQELILKFLHPRLAADERMMQRFIQELLYARQVTHENVIRIHDFLQLDNTYAISMEYFPGHNLGVEVEEERFLTDVQRGFHVLVNICRGMHVAHQLGIIHRDMKPQNILINDAGVVKIVDFGLAAAVTEPGTQLTRAGEILGTPLYMAPEQARQGQLDARADIYSLGVMMYEMFTGQTPYRGDQPLAIMFQHVEGQLTPPRAINPSLAPEVEAIILKAMAVDPAQRFQSMEAFEESLVPFLQ